MRRSSRYSAPPFQRRPFPTYPTPKHLSEQFSTPSQSPRLSGPYRLSHKPVREALLSGPPHPVENQVERTATLRNLGPETLSLLHLLLQSRPPRGRVS